MHSRLYYQGSFSNTCLVNGSRHGILLWIRIRFEANLGGAWIKASAVSLNRPRFGSHFFYLYFLSTRFLCIPTGPWPKARTFVFISDGRGFEPEWRWATSQRPQPSRDCWWSRGSEASAQRTGALLTPPFKSKGDFEAGHEVHCCGRPTAKIYLSLLFRHCHCFLAPLKPIKYPRPEHQKQTLTNKIVSRGSSSVIYTTN